MFAKHENNILKIQVLFLVFLSVTLNTTVGSSLVSYIAIVNITPVIGGPYVLYAHQETYGPYQYFRLYGADASGETLSAKANTTGRKPMGYFIFELAGVASINASTWTFYYRAQKTDTAVSAHFEVDILIRKPDGSARTWIALGEAVSGELTTSWSTLSATYAFPGYGVVNQTDYLEVDYYIDVTAKKNNQFVNLRIDDSALALTDQTRVANVIF